MSTHDGTVTSQVALAPAQESPTGGVEQGQTAPAGRKPFHLTRWFSLLSLGSILVVGVVSASLLSRFMIEQTLHRDGVVTMEFVQGLIRAHEAEPFFFRVAHERGADAQVPTPSPELGRLFKLITAMPDVIHINVYDAHSRVIWSSNKQALGKRLGDNPELAEALQGELKIESEILEGANYLKPEHAFLPFKHENFVENYVPIYGADQRGVIGVVEIYKSPAPLFRTIHSLTRWIWLSALIGSAFLFLMLLWMVRRADNLIRAQQRQLVASESVVAVGEMASTVAHGIRNPLASIRSSAELIVDAIGNPKERGEDIVGEVDRLEGWVKNLLTYAHQGSATVQPLDLNSVVRAAAEGFGREMQRLGVSHALELQEPLPKVNGDAALLSQMFNSLIANALEAMPDGGSLSIKTKLDSAVGCVDVTVRDTGVGIARGELDKIFLPFHTTKKKGLGVGLPLVKRTIERLGGAIEVTSAPGAGTAVRLRIPVQ